MALITAVEAAFPVDEWTVDGLHVWPLVRYYLYTTNYYMYRRADGHGAAPTASRIRSVLKSNRTWLDAVVRDRAHNASLASADVLLFSDGVSFSMLGGEWVEKWCDPFAIEAETIGLTPLMLTPAHLPRIPRHRPSVLIQPALDAVQAACKLSHRAHRSDARLYRFEEARAFMAEQVPGIQVPTERQLAKEAHYCRMYMRFFERVLARVRPKAVFSVSYYGGDRMALLWAARRARIPCADIQHGYAGRQHFAYGQWTRVPRGGYELLPTHFLVWGKGDHDDIQEWATQTSAHRPVIAGHRFLEMWRRGDATFAADYERKVRAAKERATQPLHVMLTLNGLETTAQMASLSRMIAQTKSGMFWWVRTHPVRPEQADAVEAALREAGADNAVVREASDLPLFALLKHMNLHVTEGSTTCFDAALFGIPSVLFTRNDAVVFESLERAGWVKTVDAPQDVPAALNSLLGKRLPEVSTIVSNAPPLADILRTMGVRIEGATARYA